MNIYAEWKSRYNRDRELVEANKAKNRYKNEMRIKSVI